MDRNSQYYFIPLKEPIPLTEQHWPEDVLPLVHTRTMTYMHEDFIKDCIEGLLMQKTTFPVQILIHDDSSTDKTAEIVREYEQKYPCLIKAFYQKENSFTKPDKHERRTEFMNWRIGKYEAICEGDDYWIDPLKLQKQVDFMEANEDCSLCFTGHKIIKSSGEKKIFKYSTLNNLIDINEYLSKNYFMATASLLFNINILNSPEEYWMKSSFAGDFILRYRALIVGKIGHIKSISVVYNKGTPGSWTKRKLNKKMILKEYSDNMRALYYISKYKVIEGRIFNKKIKQLKIIANYKYAGMNTGFHSLLLACNLKYFDLKLFLAYLKSIFIKL